MRIVVTGGAGFIGSHLCKYLLDKGEEVICVDNFFTGNKKNIQQLLNNPNFEILRHDIIQPIYIEVDQIYNLACPASPQHYQWDPIKTTLTSTVGIYHMLGIAKRCKARILQASTSEVYGDPKEHPQKETYRGNVNCIGPRSCFSEDTEVLTKEGFKFFKDLKKEDEILTLNKEGFMEYHPPEEIIRQRYIGELIEFKNSKIDLQVTPNHNMYARIRDDNRLEKFKLIKAFESIRWDRAEMLNSADWNGQEKEFFYLPQIKNSKSGNVEKIKMDDWLEFFGYYITEGCVYLRKRKKRVNNKEYDSIDYTVLIAQDRKNVIGWNKINSCLKRLHFNFFDSDDHQFRICNKQLADYLIQFGKSKEKFVPPELKNLSKRQLKILFNAMMLGDGSKSGKAFYTSSKKMAGDFQEILLKLGMAANSSVKDKRREHHVYNIHILHDKRKDFLTPKYPKRSIIEYDGYVYCVNVNNHVIYVRRNGKVLFCGNCYDEGKRVAETLMMDYHRENKVDIRIVRIFNTYGPNMAVNDGRVVSNFIIQALRNEPITVYGDGSQTRSFCFVSDMVEGIYRMMNQKNFVGPVNLGNPNEFTILELAEKVIKLTGSNSKIVYKPLPEDDPTQRKPDITLAKQKLNWEPKVQLEEGLNKTIKYFKEALSQK